MPHADPDEHRKYQREWKARRRSEWFKEHGPCVDCGSWVDLQLDHDDAKEKVDHKVWSWAKERREAELAKCVARCEPCHKAKTKAAGDALGGAKITAEIAANVRSAQGTQLEIGARFGISQQTVSDIKRGRTW